MNNHPMREKSIRYRAPAQLRQRSRHEALEPPSGTTLQIRYRRMAEETARSDHRVPGCPSGSRKATDDKTARKPRPEAGRNPRTTAGRSGASGWGQTKKRRSRPPKETAPNMFDMRYSVNAFRIPIRRRPQASTRVSPDRPDSRPSAQRSSRRPLRRQAPAACAPRR